MKRIKLILQFAACSLSLLVQASASFSYAPVDSTTDLLTLVQKPAHGKPTPHTQTVQLYFTNPNLPEWANTCGAGEFVTRKVGVSKRPADVALRLLFAGPTAEEKAKGMESLSPLGDYYLGVSIKKGVAIVNFRPGAEEYLYVSGPNCRQEQVLTPIANTLKRFATIKSVEYAINGKIIEEWDA